MSPPARAEHGCRLGVIVRSDGDWTYETLTAAIRSADEAGVDSVWVTESWARDAFTILTALATTTRTIRLATGIVNVYGRTPATLAQQFLTLNELSNGRAVAGLGMSGPKVVEGFHGVRYERPVQRLREYVDILRNLLSGGTADYEGSIFRIQNGLGVRGLPPADIPILVGALGPQLVQAAAEAGAGWLMNWTPLEQTEVEVGRFRSSLPAHCRDADIRAPRPIVIADDVSAARSSVKSTLAFYVSRMGDAYANHLRRLGYEKEVDTIVNAWQEGGRRSAVQHISDNFSDSIQLVTGSVEGAADRIAAQKASGIDIHTVEIAGCDPRTRKTIYADLLEAAA